MAEQDWPRKTSPFHQGEQKLQTLYGVRNQLESFARGVIRDYLPIQHRQFYAQLPLINLGTLDDKGRVWSSIAVGQPGFIQSPDDKTLTIASQPLAGDPLNDNLTEGRFIGVLGLELHTSRRNRLSGLISKVDNQQFSIHCLQSFGNCRQFIQNRQFEFKPEQQINHQPTVTKGAVIIDKAKALIESADTFFIATVCGDANNSQQSDDPTQGADVSHRGGLPGFVRVDNPTSLTWPDFRGNFHFNTLGNLLINPLAGIVFIDYERGDVLYLTGKAQIIWDSPEIATIGGAERLMQFTVDEAIFVEGSLPLAYQFGGYSPSLRRTGTWK